MPSTIPTLSLGDRLRIARKRADLTLHELAEKLGLKPAALSAYETGRNAPSLATITAWAAACDVDRTWLAWGDEPQAPANASMIPTSRPSESGEPDTLPHAA